MIITPLEEACLQAKFTNYTELMQFCDTIFNEFKDNFKIENNISNIELSFDYNQQSVSVNGDLTILPIRLQRLLFYYFDIKNNCILSV